MSQNSISETAPHTPGHFYVTTPIYYVNDIPHIGHAYTTVLADVLARFHRLFGDSVLFLTGTDEHGQKVQQAAAKLNRDPKEHCDLTSLRFKAAWEDLSISHDRFIRTTDSDHIAYVTERLQELWKGGHIYEKVYAGWYSTSEERFFTEKELVDGKDPISGRPVEWVEETNFFFKMSGFQDRLLAHLETHPEFVVPDFRRNEVLGFLRQPLADLCISRPKSRLSWGITLPFAPDYVTYVWVDALFNYASGMAGKTHPDGTEAWPADIHLIGKDILTTHAVYWPTLLMAVGMPLPKQILAHGWWMIEGARMSKSTGNGIDPLSMKDRYGVDSLRYFLSKEMVVGQDASFSEEAFISRVNADLANDVGNGLSRVMKLAEGRALTPVVAESEDEKELVLLAESAILALPNEINTYRLSQAIESILGIFRSVNRYLEKTAPWKMAKAGEEESLARVLFFASESLRLGFRLLVPVMPHKAEAALNILGDASEGSDSLPLRFRAEGAPRSSKVAQPLFPRIQTTVNPTSSAPSKPLPPANPFSALDLRVAQILEVKEHPEADSLYVLQLSLGKDLQNQDHPISTRQVCAGLRRHYSVSQLEGRKVLLLANLKPMKLRGQESAGMVLAAEDSEGKLHLAEIPESALLGSPVGIEELPQEPVKQITLKDFQKISLRVQSGRVCSNEKPLEVEGKPITVSIEDGAEVR
jgi:methionyl-tRNA synthetase